MFPLDSNETALFQCLLASHFIILQNYKYVVIFSSSIHCKTATFKILREKNQNKISVDNKYDFDVMTMLMIITISYDDKKDVDYDGDLKYVVVFVDDDDDACVEILC